MNITLKKLRYFDALARYRHFGRAAEACAVSQPALSLQMKELESEFGAPLLERNAREIRLSRLGEDLLGRARDILRAVDELENLTRAAQGPLAGRLRIGVIPTVAPYLLPALIKHLSEHHPSLDLRPRETVTQTLLRDLLDGKLDLAVVALPTSEPALHEEPIYEEEFVLVRSLADAGEPVPNPQALREMRLLLLEEGHCFRDQAISFCNLSASPQREMMEGSSLKTLVQMVGAGIGVTLIPEIAVPIETGVAEVSVVRLPEPRPKRQIGLVWRKSSPLVEEFAQISEILKTLDRPRMPAPA
ncbi:hydrogen peroxide-inducible genes activator [Salipiger mucosus]|uniref:Activator protein n=1 Tax=Salipiger mucosus DSM 16094 TaxID=1123237 RepID=S9Q6J4_9RHOB|nr:Activator protein [Salipiger mucosus DSM 16094]